MDLKINVGVMQMTPILNTAYNNINRENSKLFINTFVLELLLQSHSHFFTNVRLLYQNLDLYRIL